MEAIKLRKFTKKAQKLIKQRSFNNRYNITEKAQTYDSFSDPHSSYYFSSHTVLSNLRHLKKALEKEKNSSEKRKLQALIKQRKQMNMRITSVFKRKSQLCQTQQVSSKHLLKQTLGSLSFFRQTKTNNMQRNKKIASKFDNFSELRQKKEDVSKQEYVDVNFQVSENPEKKGRRKKTVKTQVQISNRLAQSLHNKKRLKWMAFLDQRKRSLISTKAIPEKKVLQQQ